MEDQAKPSDTGASVMYCKSFACMEMILCWFDLQYDTLPNGLAQEKGKVERESLTVRTCQHGDQTSVDDAMQGCK